MSVVHVTLFVCVTPRKTKKKETGDVNIVDTSEQNQELREVRGQMYNTCAHHLIPWSCAASSGYLCNCPLFSGLTIMDQNRNSIIYMQNSLRGTISHKDTYMESSYNTFPFVQLMKSHFWGSYLLSMYSFTDTWDPQSSD